MTPNGWPAPPRRRTLFATLILGTLFVAAVGVPLAVDDEMQRWSIAQALAVVATLVWLVGYTYLTGELAARADDQLIAASRPVVVGRQYCQADDHAVLAISNVGVGPALNLLVTMEGYERADDRRWNWSLAPGAESDHTVPMRERPVNGSVLCFWITYEDVAGRYWTTRVHAGIDGEGQTEVAGNEVWAAPSAERRHRGVAENLTTIRTKTNE